MQLLTMPTESTILVETRTKHFQDLDASLHQQYLRSFDSRPGDVLLVVMSPNIKFALRKFAFRHSCLYLADQKLSYYTHNPGRQSGLIQTFAHRAGFKKVLFLGSSKGATGALVWSSLVGRRKPPMSIGCLAFSPQTELYPRNENLAILPSYIGNLRRMDVDENHKINFSNYGKVVSVLAEFSVPTKVVYSSGNTMDRVEAGRLQSFDKFEFLALPLAFHGAITPYVTDLNDQAALAKLANKLFTDADKDIDLKSSLPETRDDFIAMFSAMKVENLNDCVDDFLGKF